MTPAQKEQFQAHMREKIREYAAPYGGISKTKEDAVMRRVIQRLERGDMTAMVRSALGVILPNG